MLIRSTAAGETGVLRASGRATGRTAGEASGARSTTGTTGGAGVAGSSMAGISRRSGTICGSSEPRLTSVAKSRLPSSSTCADPPRAYFRARA